MAKTDSKQLIKKIISEEIARFEKIKSLELKKKQLQEALNLLESGEMDEISWQGIKNAVGFGGKKAAEVGSAVGQSAGKAVGDAAASVGKKAAAAGNAVVNAVDKKVTNINNKVDAAGKAISDKATQIKNKITTGYQNLDAGLSQFSKDLSNAATAGDIQTLESKMTKMFSELQTIIGKLNEKQTKLGVKPTTMKSILFKVANTKKQAPMQQVAEGKKK